MDAQRPSLLARYLKCSEAEADAVRVKIRRAQKRRWREDSRESRAENSEPLTLGSRPSPAPDSGALDTLLWLLIGFVIARPEYISKLAAMPKGAFQGRLTRTKNAILAKDPRRVLAALGLNHHQGQKLSDNIWAEVMDLAGHHEIFKFISQQAQVMDPKAFISTLKKKLREVK